MLIYQGAVLIHSIGSTLEPLITTITSLGRDLGNKLLYQHGGHLPGLVQVLDQRLGFILY